MSEHVFERLRHYLCITHRGPQGFSDVSDSLPSFLILYPLIISSLQPLSAQKYRDGPAAQFSARSRQLNDLSLLHPPADPATHSCTPTMRLNVLAPACSALLFCLQGVDAQVTVYGQIPLKETISQSNSGTSTASVPAATSTLAAYDDTVLNPPPIPDPAPSTAFTLNIPAVNTSVTGLSIAQSTNSFYGFSIEMSLLTEVCKWPYRQGIFTLFDICIQWARVRTFGSYEVEIFTKVTRF